MSPSPQDLTWNSQAFSIKPLFGGAQLGFNYLLGQWKGGIYNSNSTREAGQTWVKELSCVYASICLVWEHTKSLTFLPNLFISWTVLLQCSNTVSLWPGWWCWVGGLGHTQSSALLFSETIYKIIMGFKILLQTLTLVYSYWKRHVFRVRNFLTPSLTRIGGRTQIQTLDF